MLRTTIATVLASVLCATPCIAQQANLTSAGNRPDAPAYTAPAGDHGASGIGSLSGPQILAVAKFAGACGELNAMTDFQTNTQMPGGDEFVVRMWNVESARLGLTTAQLVERCNRAISGYQQMWTVANTDQAGGR
jgi:hypothetical protein